MQFGARFGGNFDYFLPRIKCLFRIVIFVRVKSAIICLNTRELADIRNTCTPASIRRECATVQRKNETRRIRKKKKLLFSDRIR